ncbi:hypothetical protein GDO86_018846 [Hymenochirus boettgeri]|uniref:SGNH hydrolase-type esterase domain-containing protein n=1 Tax=Hymenochirus boettgeri TaxID=247094 RepID=A0A8T2IM02_9PIPI|nr:hypothetical protein GDO86_018846 [Hymenochirus boettgeri]
MERSCVSKSHSYAVQRMKMKRFVNQHGSFTGTNVYGWPNEKVLESDPSNCKRKMEQFTEQKAQDGPCGNGTDQCDTGHRGALYPKRVCNMGPNKEDCGCVYGLTTPPRQWDEWRGAESHPSFLGDKETEERTNGSEHLSQNTMDEQHMFTGTATNKEPGTARTESRPLKVLIAGHTFVCSAYKRAVESKEGEQLGIPMEHMTISWLGKEDLHWVDFHQLLNNSCTDHLDLLIVHAGGNDLTLTKGLQLTLDIKSDLMDIKERKHIKALAWSNMIPRITWPGAQSPVAIDRARKKLNRALGKLMDSNGDFVVVHKDIHIKYPELYREDGEHLSDAGLDTFNANLKHFLLQWRRSHLEEADE